MSRGSYCGPVVNDHGLQPPWYAESHKDVKHVASDGVGDCHVTEA